MEKKKEMKDRFRKKKEEKEEKSEREKLDLM